MAAWCDLLTNSVALRVLKDWNGNQGYCVVARNPSGDNMRLLWCEEEKPVLDAIINDKLLYHIRQDGVTRHMVYDLKVGDRHTNSYLKDDQKILGYTSNAVYAYAYQSSSAPNRIVIAYDKL